jgi:serine/threonine protein kinase/tetratricopeptide (TPR) repeat protein
MIGQTLGHYRIDEKIGAGGMGEVYRARDSHLDRDVAVKILPPGLLADDAARRRFRREALALARLNHPNIEAVHQFNTDRGVDYLAMEFVPGESLASRLARGPLAAKEVAQIGSQIAAALEEAHQNHIIHRDLKPGNVIVTPKGQAKVLDFGLAKLLHRDESVGSAKTSEALTEPQAVIGTLPYMAPEQLQGEESDERTDIYAAGALLYEMATGRRPFPETQGAMLIGAILSQTPRPPSEINKGVPPALEAIILKALDKNPDRRYQSAKELRVDLERVSSPTPVLQVSPRSWIARHTFPIALGALAIVLGVILVLNAGWLHDRVFQRENKVSSFSSNSESFHPRRAVAVLGFQNLSGRSDVSWLSTALAEMLTTELGAGAQLRTISGEQIARMKSDLSLKDSETYAPDTLGRIRTLAGADFVVLGSYLVLGEGSSEKIRLDLRLQDAAGGETLLAESEDGSEAELVQLVERAGTVLRSHLGVRSVSDVEISHARASLPSRPAAARLYSDGLIQLRVFNALNASSLFERAIAIDPDFAPAHSALAEAWAALGYDRKARDEALRAFSLSDDRSEEERLLIEGRYRETSHDWDKAVEIYKQLFAQFPDNVDYGLRLAGAQSSAGKAPDALQTITALRSLPGFSANDPRIDLAEADADEVTGDFQNELRVAARAIQASRDRGARLLEARALYSQAWASLNTGDAQKATESAVAAKEIYIKAGDRNGEANMARMLGTIHLMRGDIAAAASMYRESLGIARQVGNRYSEAAALNQLATTLDRQGNRTAAIDYYRQSLAILHDIGNKTAEGTCLNNIANILWARGDLPGARKMYEQALAIARELGDRERTAGTTLNVASILIQQGDLAGAHKQFEQALSVAQAIEAQSLVAAALRGLGDVLFAQDHLQGARRQYEQSLALREKLGESGTVAETQVVLAEITLEEGRASVAREQIQSALNEFRKEGVNDDVIGSSGALARALLGTGDVSGAQTAIRAAQPLLNENENPIVRLEFTIDSARVFAAAGYSSEAQRDLNAAVVEAEHLGLVQTQLEGRLALAEIEIHAAKSSEGHATLTAVQKEASALGFRLIARKAATVSGARG